jgi:hypothetical protein
MPRINRFDVEFPVGDQTWLARFTHQHNSKDGIAIRGADNKLTYVRHVTVCKISAAHITSVFLKGESYCSLKDDYNWQIGLKRAFQKALERGGYCKFDSIDNAYGERYEVVVPLKKEYGIAMHNFYREMKIKAYPPHNGPRQSFAEQAAQPVINAELVPAATANGTYHLGAD